MSRTVKISFAWVGTFAVLGVLLTIGTVEGQEPRAPRNVEEFNTMFQSLNNWCRWGDDDELGTMHLVTAAKTREAVALGRRGVTV